MLPNIRQKFSRNLKKKVVEIWQ